VPDPYAPPPMGLGRYRDLLRTPGVAPLMLAAFVGRMPYGMNILAVILLLRAAGFDYAEVGIITAASGLSVGLAAPVLGRVIDRVGQTKVLVGAAVLTAISGTAFVVAVLEGASATLVTVLAFVAGLSVPPVSPSLRSLLPSLVGRDRLDTAFALDALLLELVFVAGPLLAAGIATAISPQVAFLTGVAFQAAGGLGVAASPYSRRWRPEPPEPGTRRAGALGTAGIRVLVLALALTAIALGALEIAIPAFAEEHATRDDAGWLFALLSVGSLAGGLWYGAREWRLPPHWRFIVVTGVLVAGLALVPLAGSMPVFAVLVTLAGVGLAPSTAAAYSLVGDLAPAGAVTEAYSWQIVGYVAGSAVGAWLAGLLVEHSSVAAALACAPVAAALGLLLALAGRRAITV
jgi:MFS family permease